jgi:hypothetical protein
MSDVAPPPGTAVEIQRTTHHVSQQRTSDQAGRNRAMLTELRTTADRLATEIEQLTVDWDAVAEVDGNLGADVENAGIAVMSLLDALTGVTRSIDPLRTRQLQRFAIALHEAVQFYSELEEHETDASIDIFDRLMPGIALAQRVLDVLSDPAAGQRVTVGELIERLRQFPHHLQIYFTDPANLEGYTPLDGTAVQGEDPDPGPGDPSLFIVLGRDEIAN